MNFWLFKTEPECFSLEDLTSAPSQRTAWDGVRNYQARNFMKNMKVGEHALLYHSGKHPEVAALVEIVREAYPDHTSWDPQSNHYDPASTPDNPRWFMVDVHLVRRFTPPVSRSVLKMQPELAGMELLKRGCRLSVLPVSEAEFQHIVSIADTAL